MRHSERGGIAEPLGPGHVAVAMGGPGVRVAAGEAGIEQRIPAPQLQSD